MSKTRSGSCDGESPFACCFMSSLVLSSLVLYVLKISSFVRTMFVNLIISTVVTIYLHHHWCLHWRIGDQRTRKCWRDQHTHPWYRRQHTHNIARSVAYHHNYIQKTQLQHAKGYCQDVNVNSDSVESVVRIDNVELKNQIRTSETVQHTCTRTRPFCRDQRTHPWYRSQHACDIARSVSHHHKVIDPLSRVSHRRRQFTLLCL